MKHTLLTTILLATSLASTNALAFEMVSDETIETQRANLASNTAGMGYGPQSPRDIDTLEGSNKIKFGTAPAYQEMNLCNIHFHKFAEHKGGEFTAYAGNGNGKGFLTGFKYAGELSAAETAEVDYEICPSEKGALYPGDTIELHYVHSSAPITPGPTLGACLSEKNGNPQLRVEAQVYVVVSDDSAADFAQLTEVGVVDGYQQALNIPSDTGEPIQYAGSTTGPSYNEKASPLQVSWSVRPQVKKVSAASVAEWCKGNVFNEDHGHGVRNLVINPDLLSKGG